MAQSHVPVVDHSKFGKVRPARMGNYHALIRLSATAVPMRPFVAYAKAQQITLMY